MNKNVGIWGAVLLLFVSQLYFISNSQKNDPVVDQIRVSQNNLDVKLSHLQTQLVAQNSVLKNDFIALEDETYLTRRMVKKLADEDKKEDVERISERISSGDFSFVAEDFRNSIVLVEVEIDFYGETETGGGSGVFIDSLGYILTAQHIFEDANLNTISVTTFDGETFTARHVGYQEDADIAILKIEGSNLPRLRLGNSDELKVGEEIIAIGNPGFFDSYDFTVTKGIVSFMNREIDGLNFLQVDAPLNSGNSGGPVLNTKGEIVGIVQFGDFFTEGIAFALTSNEIRPIMRDIISQDRARLSTI